MSKLHRVKYNIASYRRDQKHVQMIQPKTKQNYTETGTK